MKKEAKNTIVFLVVLTFFFVLVDIVFGKVALSILLGMPPAPNELARRNYALNKSEDDCLILGSSRATHHYSPSIIHDSLNISVYNAGLDGHGISYVDGVLKIRTQRFKPSLIILECSSFELQNTWLNSINSLKPYYELYPQALELSQIVTGKEEKFKSKFAFYRFNSTLLPMIKTFFSSSEDTNKGYVPLETAKSKIVVNDQPTDSPIFQIDSISDKLLVDFVTTCKKENIKLVVCCSPIMGDSKNVVSVLSDRFKELEVPFFDYSNDTTFINHPQQLFKDNTHLNKQGAEIYSKMVAHRIKGLLD